jgi:putative ABC transport system ATP-binding protein
MTIIEADKVSKCYWVGQVAFPALNGVTLRINQGDFAVLAGRSGSGKTTLLNILGGLEVADGGNVVVRGDDMRALSKDQRTLFRLRHVGFVFQAYNLIRVLTARENVAFVCQLQGKDRRACLDEADQWLERVGLGDLRHRRPEQLSGGQQQRVAVARALASTPELVLADEPTANLDSATGRDLIALMQRLNQEFGTTFVISSHDPDVIASAAPLIRLEDGRVAGVPTDPAAGPPERPPCVPPSLPITRRILQALAELTEREGEP